jgi:hypothetical protein
MRNAQENPSQEPWLGRLADKSANESADTDGAFVRRVMAAHDAQQDEPWLDWLADNRAPAPASFAAQVAGVFAAGQAKRRTAGRIGRAAAALAASAALIGLIWVATPRGGQPDAGNHHASVAAVRPPPSPATHASETPILAVVPSLLPDPETAQDWISRQTRQVSTAVNFTQKQASMLVSEYAVPLQVTGLLMGLSMPTRDEPGADGIEQPQSHHTDRERLQFPCLPPLA